MPTTAQWQRWSAFLKQRKAVRINAFGVLVWAAGIALLNPARSNAADGRTLYATHCQACHQQEGAGLPGMAPPLRTGLWQRLGDKAALYFARTVLDGMTGTLLDGAFYPGPMPSWATLDDADLAALGSYVVADLNGATWDISAERVAEWRKAPMSKVELQALRASQ